MLLGSSWDAVPTWRLCGWGSGRWQPGVPACARPTAARLSLLNPEPPRFIKEPKDQIGVSGGVASFVCQATGDPRPRVTWNKKGKKVNSQRFEVSGDPRWPGLRAAPPR